MDNGSRGLVRGAFQRVLAFVYAVAATRTKVYGQVRVRRALSRARCLAPRPPPLVTRKTEPERSNHASMGPLTPLHTGGKDPGQEAQRKLLSPLTSLGSLTLVYA
eukprot:scaffold97026_cov35-Tisochrysis_lutea.AAC.1